jgi:hypothetical protein
MFNIAAEQSRIDDSKMKLSILALEGNFFTDSLLKLSDLLSNVNTNLSNRLKDISYYFSSLPENPETILEDVSYLHSKLSTLNYIDIRGKTVPIPEGFVGTYVPYSSELVTILSTIEPNTNKLFKEYNVLLESIINNGSNKILMTNYNTLYKDTEADRISIETGLKKYFTKDRLAVATVGTVIHNLSEVDTLGDHVRKIISFLKPEYLSNLQNQIDTIHSNINRLIQAIDTNILVVNKMDILDIGNGAYQVAKYLESTALVYYDASTLTHRVRDLLSVILNR